MAGRRMSGWSAGQGGSPRVWRYRRLVAGLRRRGIRALALAVPLTLTASLLTAPPALADPGERYRPGALPKTKPVPVHAVKATRPDGSAVPEVRGRSALAWPAAGSGEAALPAAPPGAASAPGTPPAPGTTSAPSSPGSAADRATRQVGQLPVRVGRPQRADAAPAPGRVRVELLDRDRSQAAKRSGVLLRVARADGASDAATVGVRLDYDAFRDAYGSDWASRLRFVQLPECALTSPNAESCQGTPVPTTNDGVRSITADVTLEPAAAGTAGRALAGKSGATALLAAEAGPSGPSGSYKATGLAPASTWQAGGSSGAFTWSYPMRVPPATGGPAPGVGLSYSSQAVDGRTAATNNQPSWIGEGFELSQGFIERRYTACSEDMTGSSTTTKTGDLCWATDNATMSLGGMSAELVRDDATGEWHPKTENASRVEHLTGATNGDDDGEHWKVTTSDGTQYWFGRNRLPGWTSGKGETNAAWTVPVYGNQAGEPCRGATFDASWCQQAWRWNLDYVVDVHGNSMSLWYERETNWYGRNLDPKKGTDYVRGGWLARIDYGTRTESEFGTVPSRVLFDTADRCLPGTTACDPATKDNWKNWPDTPWDQWCKSGETCTGRIAPTFWTAKRLAKVRTQVWDAAGGKFRDVDAWTLRHSYPEPGDGTRAGLWLAGVTHAGLVGGTITDPELTLDPVQLNNRVDGAEGRKPMNWSRLQAVHTESGAEVTVGYSDRDCVPGSRMPAAPDSNTLRCFPAYWTPDGASEPVLDWFHKYVVTAVAETDHTGGSPRVVTRYEYLGDPAWHGEDPDGITPASRRTWAQWRGYQRVRVRVGDPADETLSETRYLRGMDDDRLADGTRRDVWVTDSTGGRVEDADAFAGTTLETIGYADAGTASAGTVEVSGAVNQPWQSEPTATRVIEGVPIQARYVAVAGSRNRTALDGGRGYRYARTATTFDGYGMPVSVADLGDEATGDDDKCTRISYARNTDAWLLSPVARTLVTTVGCDAQPTSGDDVISDVRTSFDGGEFGAAPSKGDATRVEELADWAATGGRYVTINRTGYDSHGRSVEAVDATGAKTTTAYVPAVGGPVVKTSTTNALGHVDTAELEPAWAVPVATVDANGKRTDLSYDAEGRLSAVWLPIRPKSGNPDGPSMSFGYQLRSDGATVVSTKKLVAGEKYVTTYQLFDSLLRARQTQAPAVGGGRVLTDTFYDSAGRVRLVFGSHAATGTPGGTLVEPGSASGQVDPTLVLDQTRTDYDHAGRVAATVFQPGGVEKWRTTSGYGGDRVDVTPPAGGTATSTITDARDRTVELRQYQAPTPTGAYDATRYAFDRKGRASSVTDPAGNQWRYGYDQRDRVVSSVDPDKGETTSAYDDADQVTSTTDARGVTLAYAYDDLGRRTGLYEGSTSGPKRAEWSYDTLAKGQPTSSTRYVGGNAYLTEVTGYSDGYQPTGTAVTLPPSEGALAGKYAFTQSYHSDGSARTTGFPKAGGLPAENVTTGYTALGAPQTLTSNASKASPAASAYILDTAYSSIGLLQRIQWGTSEPDPWAWQTYSYEPGTNRLREVVVDREIGTPNGRVVGSTYEYEPAGTIRKITTKSVDSATSTSTDTQCFQRDHLQRLTQAWTPSSGDCAAAPTAAGQLGGPAPYWLSWEYDATGNRTGQTEHGAAGDTTTRGSYPAAKAAQPHTLRATTTTTGGTTKTAEYGYDEAGNTTWRPGATGAQTLTWDAEGHLDSVTEGGATTSFLYDASGNRLLRRDATGTTAFLPGTDLRLAKGTSDVVASRYYNHAGATVAVRTPGKLTWLASDHQGTAQVALDAVTQKVTLRRQTPFGTPRGAATAWPSTKGFVGGETDPTGLTHLGAREYDPAAGRFVSVDPVLDVADPQQMNGYAYSGNDPVTRSDPSGLYDKVSDPMGYATYYATQARKDAENHGSTDTFYEGSTWGNCPMVLLVCSSWGGSSGGGGSGGSGGADSDEKRRAQDRVNEAKKLLIEVALALGKILMDELGITDALNCFTQGDVGACVSTAVNVIGSLVGGVVGKLVSRYWNKIKKLGKLVERVKNLGSKLIKAVDEFIDSSKLFKKFARGCRNSFLPGTMVLMADGSLKPIEQIQDGDEVVATDPETGKTGKHKVVEEHSNQDTDLTDLAVEDADGRTETIHTTQHHPFWNDTAKRWEDAGALAPGTALWTADGRALRVAEVRNFTGSQNMRNLTVAELHTYYVIAGTTPVLVHNCPISMDEALDRAAAHVGDNPTSVRSGSGGVQFMSESVDEAGNSVRKIARFDVNPNSPHVQKLGPHINLETQINGKTVVKGPLKDPHTAIDPSTIRPGDYYP